MKRYIVIGAVLILLVGGYFAYNTYTSNQRAQASSDLQTVSADTGTLIATIGATGTVRSNQSASLAWGTSGTVGEVGVRLGERVSDGQELASLEQTSLAQSVILAQADLVSAQQALDDLLHSSIQQAQALQEVEAAEQALEDALNLELAQAQALQAIADAEKTAETAERDLRWSQSPANQSYIDEAEAEVVLAKDELDKAQEKYTPYANKSEDNLTRARLQTKLAEAQQQYDAAVRNLNSLQGTANPTDQAIAAANLETANAQLLEAQREWERIKDGPSQADIALLEAQLDDAKREMERLQDGPDPDDIAAAEARVAAAQATLDQVSIFAPFDGFITDVVSQPGDQVNAGTLAFKVDDLSHLLVDLEVSEVDINQVEVGQQVLLTFDAILANEYHGEVVEVAMTGTEQQGVVNFKVTVELTDADEDIKPGMTSAVSIVSTQTDNALLVPNRAVRVVDGERVVYVLSNDGEMQPVSITLGASSDTHSQVIAGDLQSGDTIVLNPPSQSFSAGPGSDNDAGRQIFGGGN